MKYGLMLSLIVSTSLSAMEVRKDLQGLTYEQLKQRERENEGRERVFQRKYAHDAWRYDDNIKKERDAIYNEGRALRTAIMMGGVIPRELIKPHSAAKNQPVVNDFDGDDEDIIFTQKPPLKRSPSFLEDNDKAADKTVESNSKTVAKALTFEEIFNANSVQKPKKIKIADQDEDSLKSKVAALQAKQDELLSLSTQDKNELAQMADRLDAIGDELYALQEQLKALRNNVNSRL